MRNTVYNQYNMFEFKRGRKSLFISSLKSTKEIGLIYSRHLCYVLFTPKGLFMFDTEVSFKITISITSILWPNPRGDGKPLDGNSRDRSDPYTLCKSIKTHTDLPVLMLY